MNAEKTGRTDLVSALMIRRNDESNWKPLMTRKTRTSRNSCVVGFMVWGLAGCSTYDVALRALGFRFGVVNKAQDKQQQASTQHQHRVFLAAVEEGKGTAKADDDEVEAPPPCSSRPACVLGGKGERVIG